MKITKFKTIGLAIAAMTSFAASSQAALVFTETTRASDGWTIVTFTGGTGDWTVPLGVTSVEVLVVGGGGSGRAAPVSGPDTRKHFLVSAAAQADYGTPVASR